MNTKYPFQYAILQYVHDAFTEEFLNVGLALYSQTPPFFQVRLLTKYRRLTNTFPDADGEHYRDYINSLQRKFNVKISEINEGQISFDGRIPAKIEEILAGVLPVDNSSLHFGAVHGGMSQDLNNTFEDLYHRFVESHLPTEKAEGRDEAIIWRSFNSSLKKYNITHQLQPTIIHTPQDDLEFDHAWKNGRWNAMQPLSFDLIHAGSIKKKSHEWFTANVLITKASDVGKIYYLLGKPSRDDISLLKAYQKAKDLLGTGDYAHKVEIIEEDAAEDFAEHIAPKIIRDTAHE